MLNGLAVAQEAPSAGADDASAAVASGGDEDGGDGADGGDAPEPAPERKVRRVREKEADGTQAQNRSFGDPVIRSRYQLNGQPLEVDPD